MDKIVSGNINYVKYTCKKKPATFYSNHATSNPPNKKFIVIKWN